MVKFIKVFFVLMISCFGVLLGEGNNPQGSYYCIGDGYTKLDSTGKLDLSKDSLNKAMFLFDEPRDYKCQILSPGLIDGGMQYCYKNCIGPSFSQAEIEKLLNIVGQNERGGNIYTIPNDIERRVRNAGMYFAHFLKVGMTGNTQCYPNHPNVSKFGLNVVRCEANWEAVPSTI